MADASSNSRSNDPLDNNLPKDSETSYRVNNENLIKCPNFKEKFNAGLFGKRNLNVYYEYLGSLPVTGTSSPSNNKILRCKVCNEDNRGDGPGNFERHLKIKHKEVSLDLFDDIQKNYRFLKSHDLPPKKSDVSKFTTSQKLCFKQCMVDMVAVDCLPLRFIEGKAFRAFMTMFLPHIRLHSRRTITRDLKTYVSQEITPKLKESLDKVPYLHLTLDLWSSRTREAVIGVKCQYINDIFKLEHRSLAFTPFQGAHTGANILAKLEERLENLGISSTQIVTVCVDNASNMTKAFNLQALYAEPWEDDDEDDEDDEDDDHIEELDEAWNDESWILVEETVTKAKWIKLSCLAHTLQLVVEYSLKNDPTCQHVLDYVNGIIIFFIRSTKWTEILKSKSNGLDLVCPVKTRWNSLFYAMDRFLKPGMKVAITKTIMDAISSKESSLATHGITNAPTPAMFHKINDIRSLLLPLKEATDCVQGDGPQIAMVVMKLLEVFDSVYNNTSTKFVQLKTNILKDMERRFSDHLSEPFYLIPAMLDPRQKVFVFEDDFSAPAWLREYPKFKTPNKKDAMDFLETYASEFFVPINRSFPEEAEVSSTSQFTLMLRKRPKLDPGSLKELIQCYIEETTTDPELSSPLAYWRVQQTKYPALAALAKRHLSVPATSASCERMFSVGGSLKRPKRARLGIDIVEDCLLYQEYRKPQIEKLLANAQEPSNPTTETEEI